MANDEVDLTFIRCPSCKSLVPATASRCRMCGFVLNSEESSGGEDQDDQNLGQKSRVRQRTISLSEDEVDDYKTEIEEDNELETFDTGSIGFEDDLTSGEDTSVNHASEEIEYVEPEQWREPSAVAIDTSQETEAKVDTEVFRLSESNQETVLVAPKNQEALRPDPVKTQHDGFVVEDESLSLESVDPAFRSIFEAAHVEPEPVEQKVADSSPLDEALDAVDDTSELQTEFQKQLAIDASVETEEPKKKRKRRRRRRRPERAEVAESDIEIQHKEFSESEDLPNEVPVAPLVDDSEEDVQQMQEPIEISLREGRDMNTRKKSNKLMSWASKQQGSLVAWLVCYHEDPNGKAIEFREGRFFVCGSQLRETDLVIDNESISTPHCLVKSDAKTGVFVQDLMSTKGTFVKKRDDKEFSLITTPEKLEYGDWLKCGDLEFMVCVVPFDD